MTLRGHERSNFQKIGSTALNINLRVKFVLRANRKLGMADLMVMSDLTLDPCFKVIEGHERSNFQKISSTALNISLRVNFVLGANRKLGMANSTVISDLTLDHCLKVKWRS